jgi:hypothetical protein
VTFHRWSSIYFIYQADGFINVKIEKKTNLENISGANGVRNGGCYLPQMGDPIWEVRFLGAFNCYFLINANIFLGIFIFVMQILLNNKIRLIVWHSGLCSFPIPVSNAGTAAADVGLRQQLYDDDEMTCSCAWC